MSKKQTYPISCIIAKLKKERTQYEMTEPTYILYTILKLSVLFFMCEKFERHKVEKRVERCSQPSFCANFLLPSVFIY